MVSHLFCLYAAHSGDFEFVSEENLQDFTKQIKLPEECFSLGNYAVVINSAQDFIDRFTLALEKNDYDGRAQLVKYYNPEEFHGHFGDESPFMKHEKYSNQKEYRFNVNTFTEGDDPLTLDIGDISDITQLMSPQEINDKLTIEFPTSV